MLQPVVRVIQEVAASVPRVLAAGHFNGGAGLFRLRFEQHVPNVDD